MGTKLGLWIDHRKALVVAVTDKGEETSLIISRVDKQPGRSGGIRSTTPYESQQVPADDSRERKFTGHLSIYYDAVIACVRNLEQTPRSCRVIVILEGSRDPSEGQRLEESGRDHEEPCGLRPWHYDVLSGVAGFRVGCVVSEHGHPHPLQLRDELHVPGRLHPVPEPLADRPVDGLCKWFRYRV